MEEAKVDISLSPMIEIDVRRKCETLVLNKDSKTVFYISQILEEILAINWIPIITAADNKSFYQEVNTLDISNRQTPQSRHYISTSTVRKRWGQDKMGKRKRST